MVCRASALGDRHAPRWDRLQHPGMQEWVHPPPHGSQTHHGHPGEDPGILPPIIPTLLQSTASLASPIHSSASHSLPDNPTAPLAGRAGSRGHHMGMRMGMRMREHCPKLSQG